MRPEAIVAGLLLATLLVPVGQAYAPPSEGDCENHGLILSAGAGNRYACTPGDGTCENHGAVVLVGPNTYACPGGECVNRGLLVGVLATYCGESGTFACAGRSCIGCAPPDVQVKKEGEGTTCAASAGRPA